MKRRFLIICMLFMGILTACGSSKDEQRIQSQEIGQELEEIAEEPEDKPEEPKDTEGTDGVSPGEDTSDSSERKEYTDGDVITYTSGLKVTIVSSGLYTKPDPLDNTVLETYAFLEVDMENTGENDISMTGSFFNFYADGYALSNVWLNEEGELPLVFTLSSGRKAKGRVYTEGPEISSAERIEAELGKAIIRIYEDGDYGVDFWDTEEEPLILEECLGALYTIYGGDEQVDLSLDETGHLCVWNGIGSTDTTFYKQTYDSYTIEGNVLYGYTGDFTDEFIFEESGLVEVLLVGTGSNHYQEYIQEDEYFDTDWRKELGLE